jgi:hypothetical protein
VPGNEVVFQTINGAIYGFHANGTEVADGDSNPGTIGVLVGGGGVFLTRAQPILADLDGQGGMEIVVGSSEFPVGGSLLTAVKVSGGVVSTCITPMLGSTEAPVAAADLDGDGLPEVIAANVATTPGEEASQSALSIANWEIFTDPDLPRGTENAAFYAVRLGGPFGAPVMADIDRDGRPDVIVADRQGRFHAFRISVRTHLPGDPPSSYVVSSELSGWPATLPGGGRAVEVSLGDLEHDGYPEVFQTGEDSRVAAFHWNGAPRAGFPVQAGDPVAPADSSGTWAPLIADVDGDGFLDVIAILPDGRRLAYSRDGARIESFGELGSTGLTAPPILADLDNDGTAEWVETFDSPTQSTVIVRETSITVGPSTLAWNQWRLGPTRNAVLPTGPAGPPPGTRILSEVYAYPNPARAGATTIHYRLSGPADHVRVQIFDPAGSLVAEPPVGAAGLAGSAEHAVVWNHVAMASGLYVCRVEVASPAGTEVSVTRLAVLR